MDENRISDSIIKVMAKNVFKFSDYWYQNYVIKNLDQEFHEQDYIEKYREPIVLTITNGIKAIESKRIDVDSYLKMGANHFHLGLSYSEMAEKQFVMEQAMEAFLRQQIAQDQLDITEEEIQFYLTEFHKLNERVAPVINEGFLIEARKQEQAQQ